VVQNVVTYAAVIDVPNEELKLKPGMTATVTIQVASRENVLRVPNAALRFRPTPEILSALGQPGVGTDSQKLAGPAGTGRRWNGGNRTDRAVAPTAGSTPGPRAQGDGTRSVRETNAPRGRTPATGAETVDALFGPLPQTESAGRVWIARNGALQPVRVRLGLSDGTHTELLGGELSDGAEVVTNVVVAAGGARSQQTTPGSANPLMPQPRAGRGPR
jgi:HlyD family secretion protein